MIEVDKYGIMKHFNQICYKLLEERERQLEKWGVQHHNHYKWLTILIEEVGEAAKSCLEMKVKDYEKEVIQIGAVAVAMLEDLYDTFPNEFKLEEEVKKND